MTESGQSNEQETAEQKNDESADWILAILRKKSDYARSAIAWLIVIAGVLFTRWVLAHWALAEYVPAVLFRFSGIVVLLFIAGWMIRRYGVLPFIMGPAYGILSLLWRLLAGGTVSAVTGSVSLVRSLDRWLRSWWIVALMLGVEIWLVVVALMESNPRSPLVLSAAIGFANLYMIYAFGRWLTSPLKCLVWVSDKYDALIHTLLSQKKTAWIEVSVGDQKLTARSLVVINKQVQASIEAIRGTAFLGGVFTLVFGLIVLLTIFGFAAVFRCMHIAVAHSFRNTAPSDPWSYVYFSVTTMLTIGYGDILPVSTAARLAACGEALSGMFLLVLAVASFSVVSVRRYEEFVCYAADKATDLADMLHDACDQEESVKGI